MLLIAAVVAVALTLAFARRIGSIVLATALVAVLVLANLAAGANAYYGTYPTGRAWLDGTPTAPPPLPSALPDRGQVVPITVAPTRSGFGARQALVYLPPAWFAQPRPALPVIMLLHDAPGGPVDWIHDGGADRIADAWADRHGGVAPVLVLPDVTGAAGAARGCVDSPLGGAETYLTADVPAAVQAQFSTLPPGRGWAVVGHSTGGGACALTLALRHPDLFATFGDFGGLAGPRVGFTNADTGPTTIALFGGSAEAFAAHEPEILLTTRPYPGSAGWFQVGGLDAEPLLAATRLVPIAQTAGVDTCLVVRPGVGAGPTMWSAAFVDALPWLAARLGLVPETPELRSACQLLPAS